MKTIFDANITKEEFDTLFKDADFTMENYLSKGPYAFSRLYHVAQLMYLRGDKEKGEEYMKKSGFPMGMLMDLAV